MRVVDDDLLDVFRSAWNCEYCGRPTPSGADPAHVFSRGAGRIDVAINLLSLCRWCHSGSHAGKPARLLLLIVVGHREKMLVSDIEDEIHRLRREPKP